MKKCKVCKIEKSLTEYDYVSNKKKYYKSKCRPCRSIHNKNYYAQRTANKPPRPTWKCEVCNIICIRSSLEKHSKGKTHLLKVAQKKRAQERLEKEKLNQSPDPPTQSSNK